MWKEHNGEKGKTEVLQKPAKAEKKATETGERKLSS